MRRFAETGSRPGPLLWPDPAMVYQFTTRMYIGVVSEALLLALLYL
ncbi:MAG: hypothetical protein WCH04_02745 [Gammaproteobacteria bacterium]